jgi:hypothetical protein
MKIVKIDYDGLSFDNGTTISHYHSQDCCENVYADWASLKDQFLDGVEFKDVVIEKIAGSGFRLVAANKNAYFVPCYNIQNGYYSNNLSLIIKSPGGEVKEVDITDCTEDRID